MKRHASFGVSLEEGPLITVYEKAKANGSFSVGSYQDFVEDTGIALVGANGWAVALVDEER
jgi:hypothetical protein